MDILIHDKPHFYKYCTSNTLEKILANQTVKWSSPSIFNDPFDIQTDLRFGFQLEDLEEPLLQEQVSIVWDDDEPKGDPEHPFFNSMLQARKNRLLRPDIGSREEFEKYFRDVEFDKKGIESELEAIKDFGKGLSKNLRVYCVSEHHDDILMWSHYAGDHSGAVIKHKVIPGKDYPICAAMPVQYREVMPVIAGVNDYLKHVTGQKELDFKQITIDFFTTKSKDWSYEREWR